jgi:hypothetical protein
MLTVVGRSVGDAEGDHHGPVRRAGHARPAQEQDPQRLVPGHDTTPAAVVIRETEGPPGVWPLAGAFLLLLRGWWRSGGSPWDHVGGQDDVPLVVCVRVVDE